MKDEKSETSGMEAFICLLLLPVIIPINAAVGGFVLSKLWGWFMVPIFNLPELTLIQAIGLGTVVGYLKAKPYAKSADSAAELMGRWLGWLVFGNAITLFFGWCVHKLM